MYRYFMLICFLSLACSKPVANQNAQQEYFNVPELVENQVEVLNKQATGVQKELEVNKKMEKTAADSVDWKKELSLFSDVNINKPVLKGTYQVDSTNDESGKVVVYTSLDQENKVKKLEVSYSQDVLKEVLVQWGDNNPIYHSEKTMVLNFDQEKLTNYQINGYQKVISTDTLFYDMKARVLY